MKRMTSAMILLLGALASTAGAEDWVDLEKTAPEALYAAKCGMCHRANGMGTVILGRRFSPELALLENREDLQGAFIDTVVRNGFGVMFPLSRGEVSDPELDGIIAYLTRERE